MKFIFLALALFLSPAANAFTPNEALHFTVKNSPQFCTLMRNESKPWLKSTNGAKTALTGAAFARASDLLEVCNILAPEFSKELLLQAEAALKADPQKALADLMAFAGSECSAQCFRISGVLARSSLGPESKSPVPGLIKDRILQNFRKAKFPSFSIALEEDKLIKFGLDAKIWTLSSADSKTFNRISEELKSSYELYLKKMPATSPDSELEAVPPAFIQNEVAGFHESEKFMEQLQQIADQLR